MSRILHAQTVIAGNANGVALVSKIPLSFWGGVDAHSEMSLMCITIFPASV